ncbi:glycosyltransferase family 4 protein [Marinobacter sp. ELB17]|uniref:glycosyltransferase family 4 protein n=1 Tax=Marinobacter sp. ELB17 TaxID=270374 RepID=UPI0000F39BC9|nr:glycosyltransferase family 4 protein [Marinobacter sp. ELB17]EAZ99804.1 putative glycosyl transferase [Marinobacter sp. ELB17]
MATFESSHELLFVVPGDPQQNTGGYRYVRELVAALNQAGAVNQPGINARITGLPGQFPQPDTVALTAMNELLASAADQSWVVLDGLAMSAMPEILEAHRSRLNLVALIHHPLADETGLSSQQQAWFFAAEKRALAAVPHVVTTSRFTAERLKDFGVSPDRIRIAQPGVEKRALGAPEHSAGGTVEDTKTIRLLCVAQLSPRKAQHQLVEALSGLKELPSWQCVLAGACDRDPHYAEQVRRQIQQADLCSSITLTGEVDGDALAALYRNADIFVLPSLYEGYGMVIDEALGVGLPVISSNGGALLHTADRPGVAMYNAGDVAALRERLGIWITKPDVLAQARLSAESESQRVRTWADTAAAFTAALTDFQSHHPHTEFSADWLSLRQPADYKARSQNLNTMLRDWLQQQSGDQVRPQPPTLVDLGTGLGSNAGYLAKVLDNSQKWLLIDQDTGLLAAAAARLEPLGLSVELRALQLLPQTFAGLLPADTRLVTASALIDLVSAQWLQALVKEVADKRAALLVVLSYAGRFELSPQHSDDDLLRVLVNQHQHGDKGLGAALGPSATAALTAELKSCGYEVHIAASDWQLGEGEGEEHAELARQLMHGWVNAAIQQDLDQSTRLRVWLDARERQLAAGDLRITVCHEDLLALPPRAG